MIVTNVSALKDRYLNRYGACLERYSRAHGRGRKARIVDEVRRVRRPAVRCFGASPVGDRENARENKQAIDALWRGLRPVYLPILAAPASWSQSWR